MSSGPEADGWAAIMNRIFEIFFQARPLWAMTALICGGGLFVVLLGLKWTRFPAASEPMMQGVDPCSQKEVENRDQLTGLLSQVGLFDRLDRWDKLFALGNKQQAAVLVVDVDRFERLNERYGPETGDAVLQEVAQRLSCEMGPADVLARIGKDRYVVLMRQAKHISQVTAFARKLQAAILVPMDVTSVQEFIETSIGIAHCTGKTRDMQRELHNATEALHCAKISHGRSIQLFEREAIHKMHGGLRIAEDLRRAISDDELVLLYHKRVDVRTGNTVGFEAQLQWQHPVRGVVSEDVFLPMIRETGVIHEVGLWALRTACFDAVEWPDFYSVGVTVACEVAMAPDFLENMSDILIETGLRAERLELEVELPYGVADRTRILNALEGLKTIGIQMVMPPLNNEPAFLATRRSFPSDRATL